MKNFKPYLYWKILGDDSSLQMSKMDLYPQLVGSNRLGQDVSSEASDKGPHNNYILRFLVAGDQ